VLIPGTPGECFEFAQTAFDLAEKLQTLVIVLSDLDIGMNLHAAHKFQSPTRPFERGKVLSAEQIEQAGAFARYKDIDQDGIPYRTLPGTAHPKAAYFTRGTGHDENGFYSENPQVYQAGVERLARKFETAADLVPAPLKDVQAGVKTGLLLYGSSQEAASEARFILQGKGLLTNCMRLRALPLGQALEEFLDEHERVYVIEQNRDAQLMTILRAEMPQYARKCFSVLHYDGLPMDAEDLAAEILKLEGHST
jgi:2-oxoglutarate ferredoxin oxidoreductase subunit alpha